MKPLKLSKAFTLIEILIAVAIMTLITGVVLVGVGVNRNRQTLLTGAETVKAALQQVQTYAKHPRSQDFRPLYYVIRFQEVGGVLSMTTRVYTDEDNIGDWKINEFNDIYQNRLTPVTLEKPEIDGVPYPDSTIISIEIGYQTGNPQQIILFVPTLLPEGFKTNPGDITNADIKFSFSDPENPSLAEAYEALPGSNKYPHLLITNGGAKIEIDMQDS